MSKARRKTLSLSAVLALVATLSFVTLLPVGAIPQSNPSFPTVTCGGTWHWVHNQTSATSGTLTATFNLAGGGSTTITVANTPSNSVNLHYHITLATGATLVSASDNVSGGRLVLSDFPVCATTSTTSSTTTTSTTPPSTSSTSTSTSSPTNP